MIKARGILKEIFTPKGLFFPVLLMLAGPALMWLTFPTSSDRTIRLYGSIMVGTFVFASWVVRLFLPPFGTIVHDGTTEGILPVISLIAILFVPLVVAIYAVLTNRSMPRRRAVWLAMLWGLFVVQVAGSVLMCIVAFGGD